jgi:dTMP kinase
MLISLEGLDGCGKTTQAHLLKAGLEELGHEVIWCREPGGTPLGQSLRDILKSGITKSPMAELLMFNASRVALLDEVVRPALADGKVVIMDRYFHSNLAYQGHGSGMPQDVVERVIHMVVKDTIPELTIFFDVDVTIAAYRLAVRAKECGAPIVDAFESRGRDFFERVRRGFQSFSSFDEDHRYVTIDGNLTTSAVHTIAYYTVLQALDKKHGHKNYPQPDHNSTSRPDPPSN